MGNSERKSESITGLGLFGTNAITSYVYYNIKL